MPAWTRDESPYRGLAYFDLHHASVFCGRSAAVHAVLAQLNSQAAAGKPFVLVLGASGAGKSSLLRAGLLHALVAERRVDKVDLWRYAILRPADAPDGDWLRGLAAALLTETALPELAGAGFADVASLSAQLAQHPEGLAGALVHALAAAADRLRLERAWNFTPNARLVLLIDPLEEIFRAPTDMRTVLTDTEQAEQLRQQNAVRDGFLTAVQTLAATGLVWILAGLRSEYYPQAAGHPVLNTLKAGAGQYDLAMPDETELAEIIRYPARAAGMAFELRAGRRLDAQLLKDTANNPNALPLLEFTLDALHQLARQRGDNTLSFDDYHTTLGGLDGSITLAAETVVSQLGDGSLDAVRDVFRQLVDLDNGKVLRRRAPLSDFQADPLQWQVVQAFINARLLSSSDSGDTHTATVEPVHEALLRTWPQLLAWLAEDQDILAIRSRMEELAANWQAASRNEGYLLNAGKQEQDATQLLKQPWLKLPPTAQDFMDQSLRKIRRRRWALRWTIGAVTVVFVLGAAGFSAVNYEQRKKAETAAGLALQVVNRLTYRLPERLSTVPGTLQILQETFEQNADLLKQIDGLRGITAESERERAANNLGRGNQRLALGDLPGALSSYRSGFAILKKLAAQDPANAGWQSDLSFSHEKVGDILAQQGDQNAALASYRASLTICEKLAAQDPANAGWQRDLSVSHDSIGNILAQQGDLNAALTSYRASLTIREKLAAQDPANAGWQRDLSVSHENIGYILAEQGDLNAALASNRASLAIAEKLAAQDPANAGWQRDLSVSHEKIGNILAQQGDLNAALASYRASLAIFEKLAAQDPANAGWQRDLSVSHEKIGNILAQQGDLIAALASYRASFTIIEKLAAQDPANAGWQRDLSVSHEKIGNILAQQGDPNTALTSYRASFTIFEKLASQDPANAEWQRDLSISHDKIGNILAQQGDLNAALVSYRASLAIAEKLASQNPANAEWQADLAFSHGKLGLLLRKAQQTNEALAEFRTSLAILAPLSAKAPDYVLWRQALETAKRYIAELEAAGGQQAGRKGKR